MCIVQSSSEEQSPINVASPNASQSNNVLSISTTPTTPESRHVPDETEPQSADVSFCGIQNVPGIPEKRKSKRSEESQIVISSPYKQSLLDHIAEQNTKPKKKCSSNPKRAKKTKVAPKSKTTVPAGTGSKDNANVRCVTDFGLNHCQERSGFSARCVKTGCMKSDAQM